MCEDFEGNAPEISIKESSSGIFSYNCTKYNKTVFAPCRMTHAVFDDCFDCLGFNRKFERFYNKNARCVSCTMKLNYGYFMLIYLLEKAGLLPSKFRMLCCICRSKEKGEQKDLTQN